MTYGGVYGNITAEESEQHTAWENWSWYSTKPSRVKKTGYEESVILKHQKEGVA